MSKSEPVDPMSFTTARTELWKRLAANAGFDSKGNLSPSADTTEWESKGYTAEEYFDEELWGGALFNLAGMGTVGELRIWEADGRRWRRVPHEAVLEIAHDPDAVGYLYVDRKEFEAMLLKRHPHSPHTDREESAFTTASAKKPKKERGRPLGSGSYEKDDMPLLEKMKNLLDTRKARSVNHAADLVAPDAVGAENSRAKRLTRRFKEWDKNGQ